MRWARWALTPGWNPTLDSIHVECGDRIQQGAVEVISKADSSRANTLSAVDVYLPDSLVMEGRNWKRLHSLEAISRRKPFRRETCEHAESTVVTNTNQESNIAG